MKTKLNMRVFFWSFFIFTMLGIRNTMFLGLAEIVGTLVGAAILAGGVAAVWTLCTRKKAVTVTPEQH